ncbi:MAG: response regulator transcription factor [Crocosphaera sp.]|uniref:response regulator transcription factor n=1 Tax=Crocosphaera sp. TaxID=2729996 RepID=UPI002586F284|nr:response regulator transcription factor [Crocosphaera sp.]MCH2248124.1 response regulator transcription factor [Crocosphaera sp.]
MEPICSPTQQKKFVIVDDHPLILGGTFNILKQYYPEAELLTANTAEEFLDKVRIIAPDLVVIDLSIPEKKGMTAQVETGIKLVQHLMKDYPLLNLMIQSSYVKALTRIKHEIESHQGGLTLADKGLSTQDILTRMNWSLQGLTHTKDLKNKLEIKSEWLEVLSLAFEQGLTDKMIAKQMNVAERTVRHYWTKIQDVLDIYPEDSKKEGKNLRVQTEIRAREEGLID